MRKRGSRDERGRSSRYPREGRPEGCDGGGGGVRQPYVTGPYGGIHGVSYLPLIAASVIQAEDKRARNKIRTGSSRRLGRRPARKKRSREEREGYLLLSSTTPEGGGGRRKEKTRGFEGKSRGARCKRRVMT